MQKVLITGISGFVGQHVLTYLESLNQPFEIYGISRHNFEFRRYKNLKLTIFQSDLNDAIQLKKIIAETQPNRIIHLASNSSVASSWINPIESFQNNTNIFLYLIEAVHSLKMPCRILSVGSSEQYGIVAENEIPLTETSTLNPISTYAVARVSQEMLSKIYSKSFGLDIVMTRSFNHIGVGQLEKFVVPSFVKRILYKKHVDHDYIFKVGDINIIRDFLDVNDVVEAYWSLLENGISGEVYNVCSGTGISLKTLIEKILELTNANFSYEVDKDLIRPSDNPIIIGSNLKINKLINWLPKISLTDSLKNIIEEWENKLKNEDIIRQSNF